MTLCNCPTESELQPYLEKLAANRDGVILVAIAADEVAPDFANASVGFFNAGERATIKAALIRCRKKRQAANVHVLPGSQDRTTAIPSKRK